MKKYITLVALLAGCAGSTPVASTTPTPEIVEAPQAEQTNQYDGVVDFLEGLLTLNTETFEVLCAETGGHYAVSANYHTCTEGLAGFSIQTSLVGTKGASVMVPASDGEALAAALIEAVGEPSFLSGLSAAWDLNDRVLVFGPVGDIAFIAILERTGTSL